MCHAPVNQPLLPVLRVHKVVTTPWPVQSVGASERYGNVDTHLLASRRQYMERLAAGTLLLERWSASKRSSGQMNNNALHAALCIMWAV